jgi:glycosyltransferase involved in cell wall biosynthesis
MDIVSVILPTYNRAGYIKDAIESALNQTYRNIELLIIDDGSTDNTQAVIEPYLKDNRIRYIKQENCGAAAARNKGLELSKGKYVAFIDSDDIWEKDKLEIQLEVMNSLPDVAIVFSDFSAKRQDGLIEKSHIRTYFTVMDTYELSYDDVFSHSNTLNNSEKVYWGNIYKTMIFGNIILTSTTLFRQEVFNTEGSFDTKYKTLEDYDLFLKLTKRFIAAFVDKPLICYRYSENQLSGDLFFGKLCTNLIDIFNKNIATIKDEEFLKKNRKKIKRRLGTFYAMQAYYHFSHDNMALSAKNYWQSIRNNPVNYRAYIYLFFSLFPVSITSFIRKLKPIGKRSAI